MMPASDIVFIKLQSHTSWKTKKCIEILCAIMSYYH